MVRRFEEIQVCPWCSAPATESQRLELSFCSNGCGCIEGEPTVHKFLCLECEEIKDTEECDCQPRKPLTLKDIDKAVSGTRIITCNKDTSWAKEMYLRGPVFSEEERRRISGMIWERNDHFLNMDQSTWVKIVIALAVIRVIMLIWN